jgi:hypothetical protein
MPIGVPPPAPICTVCNLTTVFLHTHGPRLSVPAAGNNQWRQQPQSAEQSVAGSKPRHTWQRSRSRAGFFLYTQCDGNKGGKWPCTLGAFSRLKCVDNMLEYRADASWVFSVYARLRDSTMQSQWMWRQRVQARRRAGALT